MKERPSAEFMDRTIFHRSRRTSGKYQSHVFDVAERGTHTGTNVDGPPPAWLVHSAPDRHSSDADEFESALFEGSHFIRFFKTLQNCVKHRHTWNRRLQEMTSRLLCENNHD